MRLEMVSLKLVSGMKMSKVKVHFDIIVKGSFQNSSSLPVRFLNRYVELDETVLVAQWIARWTSNPEARVRMPPRMKFLKVFVNHVNSIFVSSVDSQSTCVQMEMVSLKLVSGMKMCFQSQSSL